MSFIFNFVSNHLCCRIVFHSYLSYLTLATEEKYVFKERVWRNVVGTSTAITVVFQTFSFNYIEDYAYPVIANARYIIYDSKVAFLIVLFSCFVSSKYVRNLDSELLDCRLCLQRNRFRKAFILTLASVVARRKQQNILLSLVLQLRFYRYLSISSSKAHPTSFTLICKYRCILAEWSPGLSLR